RAPSKTHDPSRTASTTLRQYACPSASAIGGKNPTDAPESTASLSNTTNPVSSRMAESIPSTSITTDPVAARSDLAFMEETLAGRNVARRARRHRRQHGAETVPGVRPARGLQG